MPKFLCDDDHAHEHQDDQHAERQCYNSRDSTLVRAKRPE
jgi:hypothetical protein